MKFSTEGKQFFDVAGEAAAYGYDVADLTSFGFLAYVRLACRLYPGTGQSPCQRGLHMQSLAFDFTLNTKLLNHTLAVFFCAQHNLSYFRFADLVTS